MNLQEKDSWKKLGIGKYESVDGRFQIEKVMRPDYGEASWQLRNMATDERAYDTSFEGCRDKAVQMDNNQ